MRTEQQLLGLILDTACQDDRNVAAHLEHVRHLPEDAQDMYPGRGQ